MPAIRVLDLSRVLAGPYCTMLLADLGADVIKVERPGEGDETRSWGPPYAGGESAYFLSVNRGKRSVALDLARPEAQEALLRLGHGADVVVENFRPGTAERIGAGYEGLARENPQLVYCSITGYGDERPGYDFMVQADSGLMAVTGEVDGEPMKVGVAVVDVLAGYAAASAILAALLEGGGKRIEISLADVARSALVNLAQNALVTGEEPRRHGNAHASIVPYGTFDTRDGQLMLAVGNDDQWRRFCDAAGLSELVSDPRFSTNPQRVENREVLWPIVARALRVRDRDDWTALLRNVGVPCGPVRTIGETLADPQLEARGMIASLRHPAAGDLRVVANPVKLSDTSAVPDTPAPLLGQHTESILTGDLGLSRHELDELRRNHVV